MIVKGASRSGPKQLAAYLMRVGQWDTGEPVELLELQSPWANAPNGRRERAAGNLGEAFRDWQILAEGTKQGRDGLYHAEISPAPEYARTMTREQWIRSADLAAEELGLQHQPRALVLHDGKDGRRHLHIVWQRTDIDSMKIIPDQFNYVAHERASKRMELEFGHEFVPGKHAKRDRKKQPEFPREKLSRDEAQQAERLGTTKEERIAQIAALRQNCDSGLAFKAALEEAGYVLARGDRRNFMLVDGQGEMFSLSRYLPDLKGKAYKEFMAPVDPANLPTVDEARALQEQKREAIKQETPVQEPSKFLTGEIPAPKPEPVKADTSGFLQPEKAPIEPAVPPEAPAPAPAQQSPAQVHSQFLQPPQAPQPQPPAPPVDEELEAIKKALAARQAKEVQKWADLHAHELRQLEFELDQDMALKLASRDATDKNQMDALRLRLTEERRGWKGLLAAIEARWNPQLAAEKREARRQEIRDLNLRQERERKDYEALLEQTRQLEIENLKERQRQKMVEIALEHEREKERYIREHEEAKRILAEIEEQRRRLEEEQERERERNDSLREGPPPPKLGK